MKLQDPTCDTLVVSVFPLIKLGVMSHFVFLCRRQLPLSSSGGFNLFLPRGLWSDGTLRGGKLHVMRDLLMFTVLFVCQQDDKKSSGLIFMKLCGSGVCSDVVAKPVRCGEEELS